mgnify:CR=1 FL=1
MKVMAATSVMLIEGVPNVRVVAEFAFGTSDKSPLGSPSEKGRIGIAISQHGEESDELQDFLAYPLAGNYVATDDRA